MKDMSIGGVIMLDRAELGADEKEEVKNIKINILLVRKTFFSNKLLFLIRIILNIFFFDGSFAVNQSFDINFGH